MINYYLGDLLSNKNKFDYIAHGCNCFHLMGAGIAKQISLNFPNTYLSDIQNSIKGDINKLGDFTYDKNDKILNLYTQFQPGSNVDYEAIRKVFHKLNKEFYGKHIAIPRIGAGIAGGDWQIISRILYDECKNLHITIFLFPNDFNNDEIFYINKNIYKDGNLIFHQGQLCFAIFDEVNKDCFIKIK